jgi:hypothetical protein
MTSVRTQQIVAEFGDALTSSHDEFASAYSGNLSEADPLCSEVVLPDFCGINQSRLGRSIPLKNGIEKYWTLSLRTVDDDCQRRRCRVDPQEYSERSSFTKFTAMDALRYCWAW